MTIDPESNCITKRNLYSALVKVDEVCKWVPGVSTISGLSTLALSGILSCVPKENDNHYFAYIRKKDLGETSILMVPILGQAIVITYWCMLTPCIEALND